MNSPTTVQEPGPSGGQADSEHISPPDVRVAVAGSSKSAARIVAQGLKRQAEAEAAAHRARAEAQATQARADARAHKRDLRAHRRADVRARRHAGWAALANRVGSALAVARQQIAAIYSLLVYAVMVYVAATSQMQVFRQQFGWSWPRAFGAAVFLEGLGLAFALTAHALRLTGERARVSSVFTWVSALFAAAMNYSAHVMDPTLSPWMAQLQAIALGVSSLAAIVLWEVRSGARARASLRRRGRLPQPKPALGWDFCLRFPLQAFWAWSAMVDDPDIRTRRKAIKRGRKMRRARQCICAARRQTLRRWATALLGRGHKQQRKFLVELRDSARAAAARGDAQPALAYLAMLSADRSGRPASAPVGGQVEASDAVDDGQPPAETVGFESAAALGGITAVLQALAVQMDRLNRIRDDSDAEPQASALLWQLRLDELDRAFRTPDGGELPIPGRPAVIARMTELGDQVRFSWTNHATVDETRKILKARRAERGPSPITQQSAHDTATVTSQQ